MISKFMLQDMNSFNSAIFGQDFNCDFLYLSGGLDWGNVPASHNTYNYPGQIGDTFSSTKINNRDITVEGYVFYTLSKDEQNLYLRDEWNDYAYSKIKQKKKILNELINPQHTLRFIINDYYIEGKPSSTPQYGTEEGDNNVYFCKFMFSIFCANPMFKKIVDSQTVLSGDYGGFHFPFILQDNMGYIIGTRINYLMLIVENEGDVAVGGEIKLTAKAEIVNPVIENILTGEYIKINKTLQQGEVITINTVDGEEKGITGYYQGVTRDYLQYWDFSNSWFKFEAGSTMIGYSTDNGSESELEVVVTINPAKYGLEEM
ncbi:MAG: phage tail family protein [Methanobrevibacter sp.]|nr:phage tail family protein [Methanobrevibacter sp.]